MVFYGFPLNGSKVKINKINHSYSSKQEKWMVILWVFTAERPTVHISFLLKISKMNVYPMDFQQLAQKLN